MCSISKLSQLEGFGDEHDELVYKGVSNWFISFRSLFNIYYAHFSYLIVFFCIIACGVLSYRHSIENGKKYSQFWWGALIHGIISESGINSDKYWHAQAPIMLMGKSLPLHIILLYPSIIYLSMMAIHRLKLNICTEPPAVGLLAMLMEIPFRMISIKFLHITYHDSDPMYAQKLCGIPWVEIMSSLFLTTSYVSLYHFAHFYDRGNVSSIWDDSPTTNKQNMITITCGFVSPLGGFAQQILLFHVFRDFFNVNPISCLFFVVSLYLSFVLCFEPKKLEKELVKDTEGKTFLFYQVLIYLSCFLLLALFGRPQNEVSIGRHEPTGDCTTFISSRTPLGKPVKRKKYLCTEEVVQRKCFMYTFDCLDDGPPYSPAIWYTICGAQMYNKPQFFMNILSFSLLICSAFCKTLFTDTKKRLEEAKRFIVRFRSGLRRVTRRENRSRDGRSIIQTQNDTAGEEVTVGFVLVKNDHLLPKEIEIWKEKIN